ncbi:MAG: bromoperoxidase [Planctomycetota bacterium]
MSRLPFADPDPAGVERARAAKAARDLATEVSRVRPHAVTRSNGEEGDHTNPDPREASSYPANFTKGLAHNEFGVVGNAEDYEAFVEAINSPDRNVFERRVSTGEDAVKAIDEDVRWRGWESPRSGHAYDLQGPDAGAVGMAPAPRVGSSELAFEMAEVYSLALLRDVPFETIRKGGDEMIGGAGSSVRSASQLVAALNDMPFMTLNDATSSTPGQVDASGLNSFERNRRDARLQGAVKLTEQIAFRGSAPGSFVGPYISQFLLAGSASLAGRRDAAEEFASAGSRFDPSDGLIRYGTVTIDQRNVVHEVGHDHMTDWASWLLVQNGGDVGQNATYEPTRRFITTPRDLATYVHFDALYEAYLNACLMMLSMGVPFSKGFPERARGVRTPFVTFGGPHILSLVTEVATRGLKAVRRQKFNYHRRARPEAIAGRYTLLAFGAAERDCGLFVDKLGKARQAFQCSLGEIPNEIIEAVRMHNEQQNNAHGRTRDVHLPEGIDATEFDASNLLLPMAFPEGSPMHPAYGAGHATVAGACVTILKGFFEMFEDDDSGVQRPLRFGGSTRAFIPNDDGTGLVADPSVASDLTIQGELDKLAANVSIGRNMAGVHYYSDYYDSVRMGERVAVGLLLEQAPTYGDLIEMTFTSFDGDHVIISGEGGSAPTLTVLDRNGNPTSPREWWLRHVSGEQVVEDL